MHQDYRNPTSDPNHGTILHYSLSEQKGLDGAGESLESTCYEELPSGPGDTRWPRG
jgi:hypothetical protein